MVFDFLAGILDPVLNPLLVFKPLWVIIILSFFIALFISLIYKFFTDQHKMKALKDDMKKHQKEIKESKDDPQKMMKLQKKAMDKNLQYMVHSFKPTLITFIPIILIIGWINTHLGFYPILPQEEFTTTLTFEEQAGGEITLVPPDGINVIDSRTKEVSDTVNFTMKGESGEYLLEYRYKNNVFEQPILITTQQEYRQPLKTIRDSELEAIKTNLEKTRPLGGFNIFGYHPGWLMTYIFFSLVFSLSIRKILRLN